jgi:hypothetical protein
MRNDSVPSFDMLVCSSRSPVTETFPQGTQPDSPSCFVAQKNPLSSKARSSTSPGAIVSSIALNARSMRHAPSVSANQLRGVHPLRPSIAVHQTQPAMSVCLAKSGVTDSPAATEIGSA